MDESKDTRETVSDDKVVSLDYTLKVDGETIDSSDENDPIQFIQGQGHIIAGLEKQLYGMSVGESRRITVPAKEGYGEMDQNAFADVPRSEFPKNIPLEPGVALQMQDQDGAVLDAYIAEVGKDTVRLNFNHPLAGKELHFNVKIVDLRDATEEELEHGHVHGEHGEEEDEDWEDEDWEEEELEDVLELEYEDDDEMVVEDWEEDEDIDDELDGKDGKPAY
jgi:FKBP-type peptidyl-prolyl cis-trans isomerase SlyD